MPSISFLYRLRLLQEILLVRYTLFVTSQQLFVLLDLQGKPIPFCLYSRISSLIFSSFTLTYPTEQPIRTVSYHLFQLTISIFLILQILIMNHLRLTFECLFSMSKPFQFLLNIQYFLICFFCKFWKIFPLLSLFPQLHQCPLFLFDCS